MHSVVLFPLGCPCFFVADAAKCFPLRVAYVAYRAWVHVCVGAWVAAHVRVWVLGAEVRIISSNTSSMRLVRLIQLAIRSDYPGGPRPARGHAEAARSSITTI